MIRSAIKVSERVPSSIRALVALAPASAEIASPAVPPVPMEGGGASAIRQQHALPEGELGRHGPPSFERPAANQAKRLSSSVQQPGIRPQRHHSRQMPWRTGEPAVAEALTESWAGSRRYGTEAAKAASTRAWWRRRPRGCPALARARRSRRRSCSERRRSWRWQ